MADQSNRYEFDIGKMEEYHQRVDNNRLTCAHDLSYLALGLNEEAGEVAGKIKKALRGDYSLADPERRNALLNEMGDTLWYLTALALSMGTDLAEVMDVNIEKMTRRKNNGTMLGDGDNR